MDMHAYRCPRCLRACEVYEEVTSTAAPFGDRTVAESRTVMVSACCHRDAEPVVLECEACGEPTLPAPAARTLSACCEAPFVARPALAGVA